MGPPPRHELGTAPPRQLDGTTRSNNAVGTACIDAGSVQVDFNRCLSSSRDELRDARCTVTLVGSVLDVTASAVVVSDSGLGSCTTDCGFARATCALPPGSGAASTLRYAGNETPLPAACAAF